jgi:hypothetical protein
VSIPRPDILLTQAILAAKEGARGERSRSISSVPSIVMAMNLSLYSANPGTSSKKEGSPLVVIKKATL